MLGELELNTNIFGMPLVRAMELDLGRAIGTDHQIPIMLDLIMCNLEVTNLDSEVLLGADPDSPAVTDICCSLSQGRIPSTLNREPEVLAGLLNRYLRELPEPLIPVQYFSRVVGIATNPEYFPDHREADGIQQLREVVEDNAFDCVHYFVLVRVLSLIKKAVSDWWSDPGKGLEAITLFTPFILRQDNLAGKKTVDVSQGAIDSAKILVMFCDRIFIKHTQEASDVQRRHFMIAHGERASMRNLFHNGEQSNMVNLLDSNELHHNNNRDNIIGINNIGDESVRTLNKISSKEVKDLISHLDSALEDVNSLRSEVSSIQNRLKKLEQGNT